MAATYPLRIEASRYRLGLSTGADLVEAALRALTAGCDSANLAVLAGESDPIMAEVGPLFEAALNDLQLSVPSKDKATWTLLHHHLKRLSDGTVTPQVGMLMVLNEVYYPADLYKQTRHVIGDSDGLEDMLGYFYVLDEIAERPNEVSCDGKYGQAAVEAIEGHLVRLARAWLRQHGDADETKTSADELSYSFTSVSSADAQVAYLEPWEVLESGNKLHEELQREVGPNHVLLGAETRAIAHRCDCDDVLFSVVGRDFKLALVHLTWSRERDPVWPHTELFRDWDDFKTRRHDPDVEEWATR